MKNKLLILMLVVISIVFVGCDIAKEREVKTIRIGGSSVYTGSVAMVMKERELLEKYLPENVNVEWVEIETGPDLRDALLSDNIDIAGISLMTFITSYENDLPLTLVSFSGATPIKLYSNDENVKALEEFTSDSKIAITNKNTTLHTAFLATCKEQLGDSVQYDSNLSPIPGSDALASVQTGKDFNGAIFSFPLCTKADKVEGLTMLEDMSTVIKDYGIGAAFVARKDFYDDNAEIMEAFLNAQKDATDYIVNNDEEAAEFLCESFGCDKQLVVEAIKNMPPTEKVIGYDKQAQLLYEAGILKDEPTLFKDLDNYERIPK